MRACDRLVGAGRLDFEAHDDAGDCRNGEDERHCDGQAALMVDAPHEREEGGGREADDAFGLEDLRKVGEMLCEQQRDQQQHRRRERPADGGGTHRAEDKRGDDCDGRAQSEAERAQQHVGSEDGIARLDEDRQSQNHVGQRTKGGGRDRKRRNEIRDVEQRAVVVPVGGDAAGEQDDDEHGHVEDHAAPQGRIVDERALRDDGGGAQRGEYDCAGESNNETGQPPVRAQRLVTPLTDGEHDAQRHDEQRRRQHPLQHRHKLQQHPKILSSKNPTQRAQRFPFRPIPKSPTPLIPPLKCEDFPDPLHNRRGESIPLNARERFRYALPDRKLGRTALSVSGNAYRNRERATLGDHHSCGV